MIEWLHLAVAEAIGGATAGVIADGVLYAVDSAKVRSQSQVKSGSGAVFDRRLLFRGLVPSLAFGTVPVFGTFFFLYAPLRDKLQQQKGEECNVGLLMPLASAACAIPATLVGIPADIIKKRLVLGLDDSVGAAIEHAIEVRGGGTVRGLFAGWQVNLIRDIPFAVVKLSLYEVLSQQYRQFYEYESNQPISAVGASVCGIFSGVGCAIVTCPLDVINTRIKAGNTDTTSIRKVGMELVRNEGVSSLFRGLLLRSVILGVGSSIFWPIQRMVSHSLYIVT